MTDWILPLGAVLVLLYLPGALVLRSLRFPWWCAGPAGPAVTCLMLLLSSAALHLSGIGWTPIAVASSLVLLVVIAWLARVVFAGRSATEPDGSEHGARKWPSGTGAAVSIGGVVGALAVLIPAVVTIGEADTPNISYDAFFHHSATAFIRELGDSFPLTALAPMYGGQEAYYPTTWHMVASLLPADVVTSANAAVVASLSLLSPGLAALLTLVLPAGAHPWLRHAAVIGVSANASLLLSIPALGLSSGLWPFVLASALLPVGLTGMWLALVPERLGLTGKHPVRAGGLLILAGAAIVHPTSAASLAVAAAGLVAMLLLHRALDPSTRKSGVIGLALFAVTTAVVVPGVSRLGSRMASLTPLEDHNSPLVHVVRLLTDTPRISGLATSPVEIAPILVLAGVGVGISVWKRSFNGTVVVLITGAALLIAIATQSSSDLVRGLSGPWYGARERIAPLYSTGTLVLAAFGVIAVAHVLGARLMRTRPRASAAVLTALLLLLSILAASNPQRVRMLASTDYLGAENSGLAYLTPAEYEFIERTAAELDPDAVVMGIPRDGTPAYWFASGVEVVLPSMTTPQTVDAGRVATYGWTIGPANDACMSAKKLGITHLYEDRGAMSADVINPDEVERLYEGVRSFPDEYLTVVATSDGYVLYEVDLPC